MTLKGLPEGDCELEGPGTVDSASGVAMVNPASFVDPEPTVSVLKRVIHGICDVVKGNLR